MKRLLYILSVLVLFHSCKKVEQDELSVTVIVPNAFRPGSSAVCPAGDYSCNRTFNITIVNPNKVDYRMELTVYNSLQEEVFRTSSASNGWDGTVANSGTIICPQGGYRYLLKVTEPVAEKSKLFDGTVWLLR